jgi:hypothetical protein
MSGKIKPGLTARISAASPARKMEASDNVTCLAHELGIERKLAVHLGASV